MITEKIGNTEGWKCLSLGTTCFKMGDGWSSVLNSLEWIIIAFQMEEIILSYENKKAFSSFYHKKYFW